MTEAYITSAGSSAVLLGCDGSVWDLLDRRSPVRLAEGLGGLHFPKVTHRWSTTARQPGRTWKGSIADAVEFTMNVTVGDPRPPYRKGEDWRSLDGLWWEALSTDSLATLVINGQRSRAFRLGEDNEHDFAQDPALRGRADYAIACIADRPEWQGQPLSFDFEFRPREEINLFGGVSGFGPPFFIAESPLFDVATVENPGDLPVRPVWTVRGPAAAFRIGVGDEVISPPFALQSGDVVIFDGAAETITDPTGNNLWPLMGPGRVPWAAILPGDAAPLAIGMDGPGDGAQISVAFTPLYRRAWSRDLARALVLPGGGGGVPGGFGTAFGTAFGDD